MSAYYNEIEPFAVEWLRNLIAAGHIAPGDVDDRSIVEVTAGDLAGYNQCHFFAGIGVWSHALRSAGWTDERPVWTGSCPCQPFSGAGKKRGFADDRHLWPAWHRLIEKCRPAVVFGEQVASPDGLGWFDTVHADLEGAGYAVGGADLCAAGLGAPHIRQRLFFVADTEKRRQIQVCALASQSKAERDGSANSSLLGDAIGTGLALGSVEAGRHGAVRGEGAPAGETGALVGTWGAVEWVRCTDGKGRPTEPGVRPLAPGTPGRVGKLRAYGNAIVAPVAAEFVRAYMDTTTGRT